MASQGIYFNLFARDGVSPVFARVGASAEALNSKVSKIGALGNALKFAGIVGIGEGLTHAVEGAAKFQTAMTRIHTQAGVSQAEVGKLSKAVLSLAGPTATAPEELAKSLYHIESTIDKSAPASVRMAKALDEMKVAALGAKMGGADLEDVTNALNATVASGIPGAENLNQAMGALNATVGAGDMSMQDLADAMGSGMVAVVKTFGLSLTDVGAALATLGDNNIRGADAATALRVAVQAMAKPVKGSTDALDRLGLTTDTLAKDLQKGGLNKAVLDLKAHLDSAGIHGTAMGQILTDAFGRKAGPAVTIFLDQLNRLEGKYKEVGAGSKDFSKNVSDYMKTAEYHFDRLKASVEAVGIRLGTVLLPALDKMTGGLAGFVSWLSKGSDGAKALLVNFAALAGVKAALMAMKLVSTAVSGISYAFGEARAAMQLMREDSSGAMKMFAGNIRAGATGAEGALAGVTLAGAAVTAGLTLGIGALLAWRNHSAEVKQKAQELGATLDQTTGAITKNTAAWLANQLQQDGVFKAATKLGIPVGDVEAAILGQRDAIIRVNNALEGHSGAVDRDIESYRAHIKTTHDDAQAYLKVRSAVDGTSKSISTQAERVRQQAAATKAGTKALDGMTEAHHRVAKAAQSAGDVLRTSWKSGILAGAHAEGIISRLGLGMVDAGHAAAGMRSPVTRLWKSILDAKDAESAFADALDRLIGSNVSAGQAFDSFRKDVNDLAGAFAKHTKGLVGNTDAAIQNREAVYSAVQAANAHANAVVKQTGFVEKGRAALFADLEVLQKHTEKVMGNKVAADKFLRSIDALPGQVKTQFGTPGLDTAIGKVKALSRAIVNLHGKTLHVTVDASGNATFTGDGTHRANATGGYITGPGGPTSDSILSRVSNGEYVVRAASVQKYGVPFFDALNAGAFADGGLVSIFGRTQGTGRAAAAINRVVDYVAKQVEQSFTPAYSGGSAGRWTSVGQQILAMLGQPAGSIGALLRRIQFESGGNPYALNRSDINWQQGHPSVGLMQVIAGTFGAYGDRYRGVGPFAYGVSENPYANIYAGANYAVHRYGSVAAIDPRVRPEGYDTGGWLMPGRLGFNGTTQPERVLSPRESRAYARGSGPAIVIQHLTVNGVTAASSRDLARTLVRDLDDELRRHWGRGGGQAVVVRR